MLEKEAKDLRVDLPEFYTEFEAQVKKCCLKDVQPQVLFFKSGINGLLS